MARTNDHEKVLRNHVRRLLIMDGGMTNIQIAKHMTAVGIRVSDDYVGLLRKKIIREKLKSEVHWTIKVYLHDFIETMHEADRRLWQVATDGSEPARTRVHALGQIRQNRIAVLDKLFEAGVFRKQLGDLGMRTFMEIVKDAGYTTCK